MKKWIFGFRRVKIEDPELKCPNTPDCNIVTCTCGTTYCSTHITHTCITAPGGLSCAICDRPRELGSEYCDDHKGKYCEIHTGELLQNGKCIMCEGDVIIP